MRLLPPFKTISHPAALITLLFCVQPQPSFAQPPISCASLYYNGDVDPTHSLVERFLNLGAPEDIKVENPITAVPDLKDVVAYMTSYRHQLQVIQAAPGQERFAWETQQDKEMAIRAKAAASALIYEPVLKNAASSADLDTAQWIKKVFDATVDDLYLENHNQLLKTITFRELGAFRNQGNSIDYFVRQKRYRSKAWWRDSSQDAAIESSGPRKSRSLLSQLVGEGGTRKIFWPVVGNPGNGNVSLDLIRIAINYHASVKPHSLELIAKDVHNEWQPFFFERVADEWFPVKNIVEHGRKIPVKEFCMRCHVQKSRFSPRPVQMESFDDFRREGYTNDLLIHQLLDPKNWK